MFSQTFKLSGVIFNENGEALENAIIYIKGTKLSSLSDKKGSYEMSLPSADSIVVECTYLGYAKFSKSISFTDSLSFDIILRGELYNLNEVEIVSNKFNYAIYTSEENISLKNLKYENLVQDIPYILNMQTSVYSTSDAGNGVGYTSLRIRGIDQSRINVTINDVPLNDAESQNVYWVDIPDFASSTNDIRIQKGVGSSTNGTGSYGGTIALNTFGIDVNPNISINTGYGSFGTSKLGFRLNTGLMNNKYNVEARYSIINSDGFVDRSKSKLSSWYLEGAKVGSTSSIRFVTFTGKENTYQSWNGVPESVINQNTSELTKHFLRNKGTLYNTVEDSINLFKSKRTYNYYRYVNQVDDYNQSHYQLHISKTIKKFKGKSSLYYTNGKGYFEQYRHQDVLEKYGINDLVVGGEKIMNGNLARRRWLDNNFFGALMKLEYELFQNSILSFGGAVNQYNGKHFGTLVFIEGIDSFENKNYYINTGNKSDMNYYFRYEAKIKQKLIVALDLQNRNVDYTIKGNDNDGRSHDLKKKYNFFNPKILINYKINSHSLISSSAGIANREPDRSDLLDNPANNNPKHENLIDFELGYSLKKMKFDVNVNLYYMKYKDQLVTTGRLNDVGNAIRTNVPDSYRMGIEYGHQFRFNDELSWVFNATLSRNKIKKFNEILYDYTDEIKTITIEHQNSDLAYSPALLLNNEVKYSGIKNLNLILQMKYAGKQYLDNTSDENRILKDFYYGNFRAMYIPKLKFAKSLGLLCQINNITNNLFNSNGYTYSYILNGLVTENFYFPQAGINFTIGLEIKF